jgi:hypothetical protein
MARPQRATDKRAPSSASEPDDGYIDLPKAAQLTGAPYRDLWWAVLARGIKAERRRGRWYVERASLFAYPLVKYNHSSVVELEDLRLLIEGASA